MLDGLIAIIVLALTIAIWILYHKLFHVVYFNAPVALVREFAICFLLAAGIFWVVTSPIRALFNHDEPERKQIEETVTTDYGHQGQTEEANINEYEQMLAKIQEEDRKREAEEAAREQAKAEEAARQKAEWLAATPNPWIDQYFGVYVSRSFAEGEPGAVCHQLTIEPHSSSYFTITGSKVVGRYSYSDFTYAIPYPLGPDVSTTHIEYMSEIGLMAFDIIGKTQDRRIVVEITSFPDPVYMGQFIEGEDLLPDPYPWEGTYVCESDEGQKIMAVQQIDNLTLSASLYHLYPDGHEEYLEKTPTFYTHSGGDFADEGDFAFTLLQDEVTGECSIEVKQTPAYPDINLGYDGIYMKQEINESFGDF